MLCKKSYIMDSDSMYKTTRKICYGRNRKENVLLMQTLDVLKVKLEVRLRKFREEKRNLEQIVQHLNRQREGTRHDFAKRFICYILKIVFSCLL